MLRYPSCSLCTCAMSYPSYSPTPHLDHVPCTDVMIHNPSHLLRGSFSRSSSDSGSGRRGKCQLAKDPMQRARCLKRAAILPKPQKTCTCLRGSTNNHAPLNRLTLALRLHCGILPLAQEAVRALARVRRIKSSIVSAGSFLSVDR